MRPSFSIRIETRSCPQRRPIVLLCLHRRNPPCSFPQTFIRNPHNDIPVPPPPPDTYFRNDIKTALLPSSAAHTTASILLPSALSRFQQLPAALPPPNPFHPTIPNQPQPSQQNEVHHRLNSSNSGRLRQPSRRLHPQFRSAIRPGIRSGLQDSDFRINPSKGQIINTGFTVQIANVADFPALGGQDVQSQIVRVLVRAGQPFIPHYHPRGTETLNALAGVFRVSFLSEGLSPET
ncbi:hypothetical protein BWQ96_10734 [Gracilariopsis chorda]|uniref:Cupin type-1 domain-containing protein n=1 Tax=Gracilariopsis chorda TaxID=448386 RepID=A0A2V3IBT1_9FLOR|nr:hypothetical protein BWQ96_10734 [Gracilariopsis chorda]|eukprot:PXF39567.1 hypothetical protein BWQ96_10734 [Gracilariopsis chorda]